LTLLRVPLGFRILLHNPRRLLVSIAGVVLACLLMFSQTGFRNAMYDSQTELIRHLDGDLMIVNKVKYLMFAAEPFPRRRLEQAKACPGVVAVYPLYIETQTAEYRNPVDGMSRPIRVLGFNPEDMVLDFPQIREHAEELKLPDKVLFDEGSRDYFGRPHAGTRAELSNRRIEVVGTFWLGTDFLCDGSLIMSDTNYLRFFPDPGATGHLSRVQVGVVRVASNARVRDVQERLRQMLPDDVRVLTKDELVDLEALYWEKSTAIGYIFPLGMMVGLTIGVLICFQVLYSNVASYMPQFATLKAIGFTDRFLVFVVLQQAIFLAVLGFVPSVPAALLLFHVVSGLAGLLMYLTVWRCLVVFFLACVMCMIAGVIAVREVLRADPAEVFR